MLNEDDKKYLTLFAALLAIAIMGHGCMTMAALEGIASAIRMHQ